MILSKMNPNIIGFSGRLRSGKTELASICEKFGYERLYFAKPLKLLVSKLINGSIDDVNNLKNGREGWGINITEDKCRLISDETEIPYDIVCDLLMNYHFDNTRDMLQIIGTDLIRSYNPTWHVDRTRAMIKEGNKYVIDDIRFTNEKKCIEDLGGIIWFVTRPKLDEISHHSSEETLKWQEFNPYIIVNNQSLEFVKMIWEVFMSSGYEESVNARNNQLEKLINDNDYYNKIMKNKEVFNTINFLLISDDLFQYCSEYKNNIDIASVTKYDEKRLKVSWKDNKRDDNIVSNSLEIEDLKIYL